MKRQLPAKETLMFVLFYSAKTWKDGAVVTDGRIWYAKRGPGDGGADWEYTREASEAGLFGVRLRNRWLKEKGSWGGFREGVKGGVK